MKIDNRTAKKVQYRLIRFGVQGSNTNARQETGENAKVPYLQTLPTAHRNYGSTNDKNGITLYNLQFIEHRYGV